MIQGGDPLGRAPAARATTSTTRSTASSPSPLRTSSRWPTPDCAATPSPVRPEGTNGSQFFITVPGQGGRGPEWLQGKHTIFGEVADDASKAVVDTISEVPTAAGDRPIEPVVIQSIDIVAV